MKQRRVMVLSPEQVRCLASPVRAEVAAVVRAMGPSSVAQIAEQIDRPAASIHYHVGLLLREGLLQTSGTQKGRRRDEAVYELPADLFKFDESKHPEAAEEQTRAVRIMLRNIERHYRRCVEKADPESTTLLNVETLNIRLKPERIKELSHRIHALLEEAREWESEDRENSVRVSLIHVITPVVRK